MDPDHYAMKLERRPELLDEARAAYVASFEQDHGPIDPQLTARFEALFAPIEVNIAAADALADARV
jgi:hypothetical protein